MNSPQPHTFKNPRAEHGFKGQTCSIVSVGSYVPSKVLTNADLEKLVETSDEWITTRTGIKERRIAAANEFTSDIAAEAARRAMQQGGITADQIDLIIIATITPDMPFPSTACLVQQKIGAPQRSGIRSRGSLLRLYFRPRGRSAVHHVPHFQNRSGHRCGKTLFDCGLDRSQYLRALWRWGGRSHTPKPSECARVNVRLHGVGRRQGRITVHARRRQPQSRFNGKCEQPAPFPANGRQRSL